MKSLLFGRSAAAIGLAILFAATHPPHCRANTFISGFEGDLTTPFAADWEATGSVVPEDLTFVNYGVTEGTQALAVEHNPGWTQAVLLNSEELIDVVAQSDTLEMDLTVNGFDTEWRQMFMVMQGFGMGWSQAPFGIDPGDGSVEHVTTNLSIDLTDPQGEGGSANWKAAAQNAADNCEAAENCWWQIWLIFQGADLTGANRIETVIDNVRFTGAVVALTGDYNDNGVVDAADYAIWRANVGNDGSTLPNRDPANTGVVGLDDYNSWRTAFGNTAGAGAGGLAAAAVPEPTALVSLAVACLMGLFVARRR